MRLIILPSLLLALCVGPLSGQNASPGAPAESAAPAASTLTQAERAKAISYLEETRKDFQAAIAGLSEAQWKFKLAPDRWSVAEVAEHIALAEEMIWSAVGKMMKSPATPEKRAEVTVTDEVILQRIPDRSPKAQAPEQLQPTNKWGTQAELWKAFRRDAPAGDSLREGDAGGFAESHRRPSGAWIDGCVPVAAFQRRALQTAHGADPRGEGGRRFSEKLTALPQIAN